MSFIIIYYLFQLILTKKTFFKVLAMCNCGGIPKTFFGFISYVLFIAGIISSAGTLCCYFWFLNILQTLSILAFIVPPTFFFGIKALSVIHDQRTGYSEIAKKKTE